MLWPVLLPQPGQKGDILIELSWGHSHGVPTQLNCFLPLPIFQRKLAALKKHKTTIII
jgi:hypothetical protein